MNHLLFLKFTDERSLYAVIWFIFSHLINLINFGAYTTLPKLIHINIKNRKLFIIFSEIMLGMLFFRHVCPYRAQTSECSSHAITWMKKAKANVVILILINAFNLAILTWHSRLQYHCRWQSAQTNWASRFLQPWHSGNSLSLLFLPKPDGPAISLFEYWSPSSITRRSTLSSASSSSFKFFYLIFFTLFFFETNFWNM